MTICDIELQKQDFVTRLIHAAKKGIMKQDTIALADGSIGIDVHVTGMKNV